jgi:hypothetical protein
MQLCVSMAESYLEAARIRSPDRWRCARNTRHGIHFPSCRWPPLTGGRHTEKGDETDANSSNSSIPWRELRPQKHWLKMIKGCYRWKIREMWMKSPWERRGDTPSARMAPRRRIHEQYNFHPSWLAAFSIPKEWAPLFRFSFCHPFVSAALKRTARGCKWMIHIYWVVFSHP